MPTNVVVGTGTVEVGLDVAKLKADLNALKSSSGMAAKGLASAGAVAAKAFAQSASIMGQGFKRSLENVVAAARPGIVKEMARIEAVARAGAARIARAAAPKVDWLKNSTVGVGVGSLGMAARGMSQSTMRVVRRSVLAGAMTAGWLNQAIPAAASRAAQSVRDRAGRAASAISRSPVGSAARATATSVKEVIIDPIAKVMGKVSTIFAPMTRAVGRAASVFGPAMAKAASVGFRAVAQNVPGIARPLGSIAVNFGRAFASAVSAAARTATRAFATVAKTVARSFASVAKGVASSFLGVARRIGGAFKNAIGGALSLTGISGLLKGAAVVGGLGISAREAMDMEDRMFRLGRVTGFTGDRLKGLGDQFKNMAAVMPGVHLEDVFDIAEMGAKLGVTGPKLQMFTADVAKMRAVFDESDIPLAELTTGIARLSSVFHHGTEDTIKFAAVINKLDISSTASARDILDISQRMAGFASMAGMTAQETMALATALRQAGVPIETAGTSIGQILQRMASSKDMGQFAKMAGMTRKEFEKLIRVKPFESIRAVAKGLAGMDFIDASRALEKVHLDGQRVRGTELALGRVLKQLSGYLKDTNEEWNTQTSILGGFNARAETTGAQLSLLWNNVKLLGAEVGKHLMPVIKGFGAGMTDLSRDVKQFLQDNEARFAGWGNEVGKTFGKAKLLFTDFEASMTTITFKVAEKWDQMVEVMRRTGAALKPVFVSLGVFVEDLFGQIIKNISVRLENGIKNALMGFMPLLRSRFLLGADADKMLGMNFRRQPRAIRPNFGLIKTEGVWGKLKGVFDNLPLRPKTPEEEKAFAKIKKREEELANARMAGARALELSIRLERFKNQAKEGVLGFMKKWEAVVQKNKGGPRTRSERLRDEANARQAQFNAAVRNRRRQFNAAMGGKRIEPTDHTAAINKLAKKRQEAFDKQKPPATAREAQARFKADLREAEDAKRRAKVQGQIDARAAMDAAKSRVKDARELGRDVMGDIDRGMPVFGGKPGGPPMRPPGNDQASAVRSNTSALERLAKAMEGIERMMASGGQTESPFAGVLPRV